MQVKQWLLVVSAVTLMTGMTNGCGDDSAPVDEVPLVVEPYDFKSRAPWHQCPNDALDEALTTATVFDSAHHYFKSWDEGENQRAIEQRVELPTEGQWQQVGLWLELSCPGGGGCDDWDRLASLELLIDPEADEPEYLELARYITPYGRGMCQFIDVTPLAGYLKGSQTFKSYIDTWVGPGHSDGAGWQLTVKLIYFPGPDDNTPETINVWSMKNVIVGETDPGSTVADQIESVTVEIPADATRVEALFTSTGHSFGNTLNCAEFCELTHQLVVNGNAHDRSPWRRDCGSNPVQPQAGTWMHNRLGWCPGAVANPIGVDITHDVSPGHEAVISFDVHLPGGGEYVNIDPVDWKPNVRLTLQLAVYR